MRLVCLLLCLFSTGSLASDRLAGPVQAHVLSVRDGDTVLVDASIWPGQSLRVAVRIAGIDAPEMSGKCDSEKERAMLAKDRLTALVGLGPVRLKDIRGGKYFGRILADVESADGVDVGQVLLRERLVRPYRGRKRLGWCPDAELAKR